MRVVFSASAKKDWDRLDRSAQNRISRKLAFFIHSKNPLSFAEKLKDFEWGSYRFRIGSYRVVFDVKGDTIFVLRVGDRKDIYRK